MRSLHDDIGRKRVAQVEVDLLGSNGYAMWREAVRRACMSETWPYCRSTSLERSTLGKRLRRDMVHLRAHANKVPDNPVLAVAGEIFMQHGSTAPLSYIIAIRLNELRHWQPFEDIPSYDTYIDYLKELPNV